MPLIEDDIRRHYSVTDTGEWMVSKDTLTEARMLKRAYERIIDLDTQLNTAWSMISKFQATISNGLQDERIALEQEREALLNTSNDLKGKEAKRLLTATKAYTTQLERIVNGTA